jgi:MFS family permease
MFSVAAAMMVLCGAQNFWAILGLTALTGLTGELYRPASSALLADLVSTGQRVTAYSAYRVAFNMGWAFGPAAAGFLSGYGFFWLFAGDAGTSVLFGVVAYFALPRGVRATTKESGWREALCWMKKDRRLHRVLLSTLVMGLVTFQMSSTFGLQITHLGFSPKIYGLALSLNGILVVLCELPMTMVTRLFPARRVMALGYALEGVGFGLIAFAHSMAALAGCVVIFTVGEMLVMPVASAYMAQLAPANMRGRYMGVYGLMWSMALTVGPALGMRLFAVGQYALWLTCGGLGLLAGAIIAERRRGIQEF